MKVNWDDYSQYMETYKMFQTTNQKFHSKSVAIETGYWFMYNWLKETIGEWM
jgi:hypothetical protein